MRDDKAKVRPNTVTVDLGPRLRARLDEAKHAGGEFAEPRKDAEIVREALLLWAGESPQALDAYEMWLLRASRASRAHNRQEWARKMRGLEVLLRGITEKAAMEAGLNASLIDLSGQDGEQSGSASDRPDVRKAANRRAPKAR